MHMLFGPCNCSPTLQSLSRRGLLCAGGAGFLTALASTLIGSGRTAQAKTLGGSVPEVDRVNVTIVSDIMVRRNVATQKFDGLTVERAQPNEVADKPPRATLVGEWGLSMHAESHRGDEVRQILVDFGYNPGHLAQQHADLKALAREIRCASAKPWSLRSFRRDGGLPDGCKGEAQEPIAALHRRGRLFLHANLFQWRSVRRAGSEGGHGCQPAAHDGRGACDRCRSCFHHRENCAKRL